jgi:hypothetical protein
VSVIVHDGKGGVYVPCGTCGSLHLPVAEGARCPFAAPTAK